MLFNSFVFLLAFLPITYSVFWSLGSAQSRYRWLAVTGYVFYGWWNAKFCLLMAFSTTVSYLAGRGLLKYESRRLRRLCVVIPVTIDLSLLAFFKYANFAMGSARDVISLFGYHARIPTLDVILPIGISFYTFHTITYIVDSYRRTIRPTKNLLEFAAYVSLFSQLVAGPIVRFRQIEGDLERLGTAHRQRWLRLGIVFFVYGLVEKVLVADHLAIQVDLALGQYGTLSTTGAWLAILGYTLQLYFDFCGYSDMAVGLGYMFGLRIPQNFNSPYKAVDPSDFWRRWHMSLSSCLRDYLYIPLGGNRDGTFNTYRNLMLTMLLGGLWHGANWTFVIWGGYHGLLLCLHRLFPTKWGAMPSQVRRAGMFFLAVVGWVFFRATGFTMAFTLLGRMFVPHAGELGADARMALVLVPLAAAWAMAGPNAFDLFTSFRWRTWHGYATAVALGACVAVMAAGDNSPFLYFQF